MKIKDSYVIQQIEDDYIVVPIGTAADGLRGVIKLNETGAFLWNLLSKKDQTVDELIDAICAEYGINEELARKDVCHVVDQLQEIGCFE